MKNRKLLLIVSLVLAMTMSLGGTLAYLTDSDADVNTMVLGNVKITQNEQQRVEIGNAAAGLESFEDGQMMLPAVYDLKDADGKSLDPAREVVEVNGYKITYGGGMRTFPNYMDKIVTVTNNSNTDAYIRTIIAVPAGLNENDTDGDVSEQWLHYNFVSDTDTEPANGWYWGKSKADGEYPEKYMLDNVNLFGDGKLYDITVATNKNAIPGNTTTAPNLVGLYLDNDVDYKDGAYYGKNANGGTEPVKVWEGTELKVYVLSQAVQASGFSDAWTAFTNSFGDVTEDKVKEWFANPSIDTPSSDWPSNEPVDKENKTVVKTLQELKDALAADEPYIMFGADIEGNVTVTQKEGVNVVIDGAGYEYKGILTVYGNARKTGAETLTIKNIDFVAAAGAEACILSPSRDLYGYSYSHNVTVENCTFTDSDDDVNCAAIRMKNGGDMYWTVIGCTVNSGMHSLMQAANVEAGLTITDCKVYSENGINLSQTYELTMSGCTFTTKGHAVRFGQSGNPTDAVKTFSITNSTLKSENADGDAVIIFRGSATKNATLTLTNTNLFGTPDISGVVEGVTVIR